PLHRVARGGYESDCVAVIDILLAGGANIDAKENDGRTPLAVAIGERRTGMASPLRGQGAR
ncbi:MAG TPA: ankyrin repeat domain-containing protein, partial [Myxococcota bacterium]|nr:ankyrin repeat domain-containing protein [Myxococcota bacterium]